MMSFLIKFLTVVTISISLIVIYQLLQVIQLVKKVKALPVDDTSSSKGKAQVKTVPAEKRKNPAYAFGVVVVLVSAFFTFFASTVPQVEFHPPEKVEIAADLSGDDLAKIGKEIFEGKGSCLLCHTVNGDGLRAPDLAGTGDVSTTRIEGYSSEDYLFESLYFPAKYVVEGYTPSMPSANKPPSQLTDGEMIAVVAYLQSMGGEITVSPSTKPDFDKIGE